ncbi:MAG: hypothetical protein EXR61_02760 [Chloroflexi bacterium]|nr:hypothetical protein [Chloroflexota bacterium]
MATIQGVVDDYFSHLTLAGRADKTIAHYHDYVDDFLRFATSHGVGAASAPRRITRELVTAYQLDLAGRTTTAGGRLALATRNLYASALRGVLRHGVTVLGLDLPAPDTVVMAKIGDRSTRRMESADFDALKDAIPKASANGLRDRAILEVLFATGCRLAELCALTRRRVDLRTREVEVLGKGRKLRGTYLTADAATWLGRYLGTRRDDSPHLFVSRQRVRRVLEPRGSGERKSVRAIYPLSPRAVQSLVARLSLRAGLPEDLSPHWFRHGRLTIVARHAGLLAAQELAGHASPQTTRRYTKITSAELKRHFDESERKERGLEP